jgi:hypothetical protein
MKVGGILPAIAIAVALSGVPLAGQAAEKRPWEFLKELVTKPMHKMERRARAPREKPTDGEQANAGPSAEEAALPGDETPVPVPRPRPEHRSAGRATPDFDAAFVPPPVLKVPRAGDKPQPAPAADAEPEVIPLGPPGAGADKQASFPFPIPRRRPEGLGVAPLAMLPEDQAPAVADQPAMPRIGSCATELAALGVDASPLAPVAEGACTVAAPVSINAFENGAVKLPIKALINCEIAKTAARWFHDTVQPTATASFGAPVTAVRVAASYDCRTRDHIVGAKLSEHAFGNAVDFSAFQVKGRWIEVGGSHPPDEQGFIDGIRGKACGPFKTVLGPGSDSYHADHLHLDLAKRRTAGPSKGLYCK